MHHLLLLHCFFSSFIVFKWEKRFLVQLDLYAIGSFACACLNEVWHENKGISCKWIVGVKVGWVSRFEN